MVNLERHTYKRDDVVKPKPYEDRILYPYNRQVLPKRRNTVRMNQRAYRWRWLASLWWSNKGMKWSFENISTWSSDWPKEWLISVQSSSTTTLMDRSSTTEESYTQATLRKIGCHSVWIDTHLLEMKVEATYGFKRWPNAKSKPRCALSEPNT
jgi:hypothetical protein